MAGVQNRINDAHAFLALSFCSGSAHGGGVFELPHPPAFTTQAAATHSCSHKERANASCRHSRSERANAPSVRPLFAPVIRRAGQTNARRHGGGAGAN